MTSPSETAEAGQLGLSQEDILSNTGKRFRRERTKNACVACHQRKVKCDLNLNQPCSICTSFNFKCVLREHKKKRVRRSKKTNLNLLDSTQLDTIKLNPVDIIKYDTYKTTPSQTGSPNALPSLPPPPPPSSSIIETTQSTRKLDETEIKILNVIGSFNLPSSEYSLRLINTYFDKMNPLSPVLEKTYFFQQYINEDNNKLLQPPSLTLLQCVLFCGLMGSIDANWSEAQMETFKMMLNLLYKRGKSLFDARIDDNPLVVVQSAILLNWFDYSPVYCPHYVEWNRLALIIAKENKFHRIKPHVPLNLTAMVNNEQIIVVNRMKLSCWWTLYMRDTLSSIHDGHPFGINLNDCDILLPYYQELNGTTTDHSQYSIKLQNEFRLNTESFPVIQSTKFLHLVSIKLTNFDKMDILSFDKLMIQYLKSFLINNPNNTTRKAPKTSILNLSLFDYTNLLSFNCSILLIHKMNIFKNYSTSSSTSYFPSWKLTFEIAVNIIKIVTFLIASPKHKSNLIPAATTIAYSLYSSAMLLVYHLYNADPIVAGITKTYINKSIDSLRSVSIYTAQSANYLKAIDSILSNELYQHVLIGRLIYSRKKGNGRKISISSLIQSHSNINNDRNEEMFRNNVYLKKTLNFESIDPNIVSSSTTYESRPDDAIDLNELFFSVPEVSLTTDQNQDDIDDVDGCDDYSSTNSSSNTPVLSPASTGLRSPRLRTPVASQLSRASLSSTLSTLEDGSYDYDRTGSMSSLDGDGNSQTMTFFDIDQFSLKNFTYDWIPDFKIKPYSELRESLQNLENLDSIFGNRDFLKSYDWSNVT